MRSILQRWMSEQCRRSWRRHWKGILERRQQVFNREDLECLDPEYFEIIYMDDRDVIIMSRNTGHVWYIHNPEYPLMGFCIIFHKHKVSHPRTISMAAVIRCGRLCGALRDMISGRWVEERLQIDIV